MFRIYFLFCFSIFFVLISFTKSRHAGLYLQSPRTVLESAADDYHHDLHEVGGLLLSLKEAYTSIDNADASSLQSQLSATRDGFKKLEFILDYLDPELVSKYINGAPLPKVDEHVADIVILEPRGLQTLDELIYLDPKEGYERIGQIIEELNSTWKKATQFQLNKRLQHRYLIESIRYGVLRVFTLGLTGFDTPGSGRGLEESRIAWQSMYEYFRLYDHPVFENKRSYYEEVESLFKKGAEMLNNDHEFDDFPRAEFAREVVQPLYKNLLTFQKKLGIELRHEVDQTLYAHNYMSEEFFDADFFNAAFYTQISEQDLEKKEVQELGRTLFFDPIMSKDLNMSCASCHDPQLGFADGLPKSRTTKEGVTTSRNSMTLLNAALYGKYFWDMREYDLERQIKHVVHNELEFNMDFLEVADRLKESEEYLEMFRQAYGERDKYGISTWSISNALAAYVYSLTSFHSPWDQYVNGQIEDIAPEVKRGFDLFMGKASCGTCHFAPAFNGTVPPFYKDSESEVLGIMDGPDTLSSALDNDPGRIASGLPRDEAEHLFRSMKTVTVRNAALTAPYMHNGSLATLEEVVAFYNHGGGAGIGREVEHQTLPADHLNLSDVEQADLVAFMKSLTDTTGLTTVPQSLPDFPKDSEYNQRKIAY